MKSEQVTSGKLDGDVWFAMAVALLAAIAFSWSIDPIQQPFDYTLRTASALLHGHLGWTEEPESWLNETVPANGTHYSVFPLGAVLTVAPVALLTGAHLIDFFPGGVIGSIIAGCSVYLLLRLTALRSSTPTRCVVLALFPIFGSWFWTNVGLGGAWQIALGFAVLGQLGALYFTLIRPWPLTAGAFFALAIGNRTELLLILPIFLWLWLPPAADTDPIVYRNILPALSAARMKLLRFLAVPLLLLIATAAYNFARFHSFFDFGYTRIPDVLSEPWYKHGLFSLYAIPYNAYAMLFQGFQYNDAFPFFEPDPFGCSIFLASPLLFLLFRGRGRLATVAWIAIGILTLALWCHGNPGGWQFSYRYSLILLPWFFLLLLEGGGPDLSISEAALFAVSVAINAAATYLFLWTDRIQVQ